ncbi:MAG TPA: hypothetical protein D7I05_08205, partial [Candidatus Poseidoniales archaeon]
MMAEEGSKGLGLESWLLVALVVTILMSATVITLVSAGKDVVFSPYEETDTDLSYQQITDARGSFGEDQGGMGYTIANTMSTPMLVNDWKEPHRTLLVIA